MKRALRWLRNGLLAVLVLTALAVLAGYLLLRASLPDLDGRRQLSGLEAPAAILRDAQGLVHIEAETRADIAFALGFAHGQDRFFQLDLQRRDAAGELSALFGGLAVRRDRANRIHRFRARAERNFDLATPGVRRLLVAYANGVNSGLADLASPPFEYTLLRSDPEPWKPADAFLTIFAMTLVLQDPQGGVERAQGLMRDVLPDDLHAFFSQEGGRWDAPLFGEPFEEQAVPASGFDLLLEDDAELAYGPFQDADLLPGSNNWAVSGRLTVHGGALVADDMHLGHGIPNIWYRASWVDPRHGRRVAGVTLPGAPFIVVGSNGRVAWGFTNTQGDWNDVIQLTVSDDGERYRTPEGWAKFVRFQETIAVKGDEAELLEVRETRWGPVIGEDHEGRPLALRWTAHDPEGANFNLTALELADDVFAPAEGAHRFGIPHQNLVMGDADGNIAWTIAGPVPRREGFDGRLPGPWHTGERGWAGYYGTDGHPRLVNPESGRLWSANARVVSGEAYEKMGNANAALGARQQQIRDRLFERETFGEDDMLALQLDDEARFLARWRTRLLALFEDPAFEADPWLDEARDLVVGWSGRASADDAGYRLVRGFRFAVLERIAAPLESALRCHDDRFSVWRFLRQFEYPAWTLLEARPAHLLNPEFDSWSALERGALRSVVDQLTAAGPLADATWGERNRLEIRHPLADALPVLGDWLLALPTTPMSGDSHLPRVQSPTWGASERFAVSPGRETEAYLHMPAGQSGHPLSPFLDAGHEDWIEGRPTPFLPGEAVHRLDLFPADSG